MSEINRAIGERPALEWVPVEQIDVDGNYQRMVKPALVDKILRRFSWAKFGAIVLSRKDNGRFNVIEGQHRWSAAAETALTKAIAEIYNKGKRVNTIMIGETR